MLEQVRSNDSAFRERMLLAEVETLRSRLEESEETLRAIRSGEVDALVIQGATGEQVFTLKGADQSYRILIENMSEGALIITAEGLILYANRRFADILKAPLEKVTGSMIETWIAPESLLKFQSLLSKSKGVTDDSHHEELRLRAATGKKVAVYLSSSIPPIDATEDFFCLLATDLTEINERKNSEEKLKLAASVFTHAREGIMITNVDGKIVDVNDSFSHITGYSREEAMGRNASLLSSSLHDREYFAAMWRDLIEKGKWYGEIWNKRKNGEIFAETQNISALRDARGNTTHYVALFSDITAIKEHERELEHIAHYDTLTKLPNRVLFADRLRQAMAQAQRRAQPLAVAYLDLDGFKAVNDTHGHEIGDELLIALANRMKQALREGDTLARLGGDEFVAILPDLMDIDACEPSLVRLLNAAARPLQIGGFTVQVSASIGVTFFPQDDEIEADQLLRQADQAMYQAKLTGKNRYHVFNAEQDRNLRGLHETLARIRHAMAEDEFVLYYQPKVNMRTGELIGAEALIRWKHPERGLLLPAMFLPVIEDHSLSVKLGEWVIDSALTQIERWHDAGLSVPVSVNIGARQLQQVDFVDRLRSLLAAHPKVDPYNLQMEVVETSALEDMARVSHVIEACRKLGVLFSLDDFGTGYSSLTYLKRLPVSQLKIDQSFVSDMLNNPDDLSILEGVLRLAIAFRRKVIAEGVETLEHGTMLLQLGCDLAQGYGIAPPMPASELPGWISTWRIDPAWRNLSSVMHTDLPLLFAGAEHYALVASVECYLKGECETPMPLVQQPCRFDAWLQAVPAARHHCDPGIKAIEGLHMQVHAAAAKLCELHAHGRNSELPAALEELHELRDALLKQLKTLIVPAESRN